jgi:hypothetical protein
MFFKSFMPEPIFGSSGSRKSGRSRSDRKGASASLSPRVPTYSPKPRLRPKTVKSLTTSHSGPNVDGSAGYTRTTSYNSKGSVGSPKIKTSRGDSVTANGSSGMKIGNTIYNTSSVNAPKPTPVVRNAPKKAPVNIAADTTSTAAGSAAGSTGGSSGKIKASKAQEDNLTVKRKARGTSKYQVTKASKNPLVVSKSNKKKVV